MTANSSFRLQVLIRSCSSRAFNALALEIHGISLTLSVSPPTLQLEASSMYFDGSGSLVKTTFLEPHKARVCSTLAFLFTFVLYTLLYFELCSWYYVNGEPSVSTLSRSHRLSKKKHNELWIQNQCAQRKKSLPYASFYSSLWRLRVWHETI